MSSLVGYLRSYPLCAVFIVLIFFTSFSACTSQSQNNPIITQYLEWGDLQVIKTHLSESGLRVTTIDDKHQISDIDDYKESILLIIGVQKEFSSQDFNDIHALLKNGGNVIIADDGNLSNRISQNWDVVFDGSLVFVQYSFLINSSLDRKSVV
jgi:hypothetical protein